jgi:glucosamine kinase
MYDPLLLGIDGGGTQCRARLCTLAGETIGRGIAGPANIRFGLRESFTAILDATSQSLAMAGLPRQDERRIFACLALAGATEPDGLAAARGYRHPFAGVMITSDVHAACVGAHRGGDGGVVVAGTGTISFATRGGRHLRVGGWGFPLSDEGSGAQIGSEALRRVLWAHDRREEWTPLLHSLFARFERDPHAIVRFMTDAKPRDFGAFARTVAEHAAQGDRVGGELMAQAASQIEGLITPLLQFGVARVSLVGGLAQAIAPLLPQPIRDRLVEPIGDALDGALTLARALATTQATAATSEGGTASEDQTA